MEMFRAAGAPLLALSYCAVKYGLILALPAPIFA